MRNTFHLTVFLVVTLLAMLATPSALAVTFAVNSTLDQPDDLTMPGTCHTAAGTCTLRAAVMQANRSSGAGATIVVPAGTYGLTIPAAGADGETNGDLNLTTPASGNPVTTITGAGASTTIIDANQLARVFHVHSGRTATISGVTIRNGFALGSISTGTGLGGGIFNQGSLTMSNVAITGNQSLSGGGIHSGHDLTLMNSTISRNNAIEFGGGLNNDVGAAYVISSTIDNNNAFLGGGIANEGSVFIVNSTISQNNANRDGGGIYNSGVANAYTYNTSIVFNGADADADRDGGSGGGIFNVTTTTGGAFNLRNTLVAGNNVHNAPVYDDCAGTLNSYGRNLFWVVDGCTINNVAGGSWTTLNALTTLGPLQNNGGPTFTNALKPGSNAIDGGDPVAGCIDESGPLFADQRGFPRVAGVRCDIGAFEFNPVSAPVLVSTVSRRVHGAAGTYNLPLSSVVTNPTTEPRIGPSQTIVFTFDKPVSAATATITEGVASAGAPTFSGSDVFVNLSGVNNQQYVTVALTNVSSVDGGTGGGGSIRIGFLAGDVNQNRVVTVADVGLINAQLAQVVNAANYLKDVTVSGTLTVADKGIANINLTKALPAP